MYMVLTIKKQLEGYRKVFNGKQPPHALLPLSPSPAETAIISRVSLHGPHHMLCGPQSSSAVTSLAPPCKIPTQVNVWQKWGAAKCLLNKGKKETRSQVQAQSGVYTLPHTAHPFPHSLDPNRPPATPPPAVGFGLILEYECGAAAAPSWGRGLPSAGNLLFTLLLSKFDLRQHLGPMAEACP